MTTSLGPALDERLDHLPARPAAHYLAAGRTALRRRRARRAVTAAGAALAAVVAVGALLPTGPEQASEHSPAVAARPAPAGPSLSALDVEPGTGSADAFSTDEIPAWATEYGNHGPAAIAPDGRLWIAPDAVAVCTIVDPLVGVEGVEHSYAVEAELEGSLQWSFVYRSAGVPGSLGTLDDPGRWTADLGVWAENEVAAVRGEPRFAARLATFDGASPTLVPGPGARIVRQASRVSLPGRPPRARQSVAQVEIAGQTWFVLGVGTRTSTEYYEAYDAASAGASDLDGFVAFLESDGGE